jgi:two-component system, cell cycle response regulator DivK
MTQHHALPKSGGGPHECVPGVSILLVDDFEDGLELYQEYLTYRGYRVIVARSGEEAVAQAHAHRPDLIMMDVRMPRMTGTEAMQILRTDPTFGRIPIVALTAHAMEDERSAALAAGFDELIAKPCLPDQLVRAVERIVATTRGTREKPAEELFWSKRGVVSCATHAPAPASENWKLQGWQLVPAWRRTVHLSALQCQFCHGRSVVHSSRETKAAG